MSKKLTTVVAALVLPVMFSGTGVAVSQKAKTPPEAPSLHAAFGVDADSLIFTGIVRKTTGGTALVTSKGTYVLDGGNFDAIVGREVNVVGTIVRDGGIRKIEVARAHLAQ